MPAGNQVPSWPANNPWSRVWTCSGDGGSPAISMNITYVFAGLVVADRDRAAAWYERLLGRPPTFLPNDAEAVWQVAGTASMYLLANAGHVDRGVSTLVNDLDAGLAKIAARRS
jgi:hypothetical protein